MHKSLLAFFILIPLAGRCQQLSHPVMASRDDLSWNRRPLLVSPDTVDVLAVMVQFVADDDAGTTGTGRFDLSPSSDPVIDAPPHNGSYFGNHLAFLENYFSRSSDARQIIRTTLVDTVYTLSKEMGEYSPQRNETNLKLAQLAEETWQLVDASHRVPDYSGYDCFVIFHAGTGRDIDLASLLGFDPTPRDLPSLFIGPGGFREAFGADYPGIIVNNGQDTIANSAILPETESRLIPTVSGDVLLELSFNGLLCASVGSYLGLPDLFNTSDGFSAIGRFGLMDGQAIFSFLGLFPPEPSAWEKYWLGWIGPITAMTGEHGVSLPAVGLTVSDSVYRVPISAGEYFLLENRQRDARKDGATVTSVFNGTTTVRTFQNDTTGFNAFDVSALSGVITDVDEPDWSLPGGVDQDGNELNGGTLIWHIDEAIIQREIGANRVNADPAMRGVDVEEADGSQDIGQQYGFLSAGSGSEEGTPLDLWYDGNPSPVYENEFSATSFPSTSSNSGAMSHLIVRDFSASDARMTATIVVGDNQITPVMTFPRTTDQFLPLPSVTVGAVVPGDFSSMFATATGRAVPVFGLEGDSTVVPEAAGRVFGWNGDGGPAISGSFADGELVRGATDGGGAILETAIAIGDLNSDGLPELILGQGRATGTPGGGSNAGALQAFTAVDTDGDSLADSYFDIPIARRPVLPPVLSDSVIAFPADGGNIYFVNLPGLSVDSVHYPIPSQDSIVGVSRSLEQGGFIVTASDGSVFLVTYSPTGVNSGITDQIKLSAAVAGPAASGYVGTNKTSLSIAVTTTDGFLYLLDQDLNILPGFPVGTGLTCSQPPALADVDMDGERDIVMFSGNTLRAYNFGGVLLDHFPVSLNPPEDITSAPIVADVDGDADPDIVAVSESGLVVAYDRNGTLATGFPLQSGTGNHSAAALEIPVPALSVIGIGLVVGSSDDGSVSAWKTGSHPAVGPATLLPWPQYQKDAMKSGVATESISGTPVSQSFFPPDRVYNWPNPVYDNVTYIRFYVARNAEVSVKIFDMAGELVAELSGNATGGIDNEIPWDVTEIQSGIYFARVMASDGSGSGDSVIKVAVVK